MVANGVADKVTIENSKLPYPSETVRSSKSNPQDQIQTEEESSKDVVLEDPVSFYTILYYFNIYKFEI